MVSFHGLKGAVDADRGAMRDLLAALVATPTENPPATGYFPCVPLLESTLTALGFPYERIDITSPADAPRAAVRAWLGAAGPAFGSTATVEDRSPGDLRVHPTARRPPLPPS